MDNAGWCAKMVKTVSQAAQTVNDAVSLVVIWQSNQWRLIECFPGPLLTQPNKQMNKGQTDNAGKIHGSRGLKCHCFRFLSSYMLLKLANLFLAPVNHEDWNSRCLESRGMAGWASAKTSLGLGNAVIIRVLNKVLHLPAAGKSVGSGVDWGAQEGCQDMQRRSWHLERGRSLGLSWSWHGQGLSRVQILGFLGRLAELPFDAWEHITPNIRRFPSTKRR